MAPSWIPFSLYQPALPIPLLPCHWLFSFLLDQSGTLGRQGETMTHLCIVKQMQHKWMQQSLRSEAIILWHKWTQQPLHSEANVIFHNAGPQKISWGFWRQSCKVHVCWDMANVVAPRLTRRQNPDMMLLSLQLLNKNIQRVLHLYWVQEEYGWKQRHTVSINIKLPHLAPPSKKGNFHRKHSDDSNPRSSV